MVSLARVLFFVCVVTVTDGLKLIWMKTQLRKERGGENKEVLVIYTQTKRGVQVWPRREGSINLLCMHGGFCGRRSWQGAAVLPPALRQQLLRKRRRPEGAATRLTLSPSLFSPVCLYLSPILTRVVFSTHTHTHAEWDEIHKKLACCLCSNKTLKIYQVNLNFWWTLLFVLFTWKVVYMKINYRQFNGNEIFFLFCFLSRWWQ